MPELPEVETIVRNLREGGRNSPSIVGEKIFKAEVFWPKTISEPSVKNFKDRIRNQKVVSISRRAKYINIQLSKDNLLIHLRMSGDVLVRKSKKPLGKYSRAAIYFKNDLQLSFDNPRKFGRMWLIADPEKIFKKLGPEPLGKDFNHFKFHEMLLTRKRLLKPLLMDQNFIAGIGNIYADESLNLAKVHPCRRSHTISLEEAKNIYDALQSVLKEGIKRNGASIDWVYKGGEFQNYFRVYQRTGDPCLSCGTAIARIVVGQRGTHFCPSCQLDRSS